MKILLINELYKMGGAEMQTLRETELLRAKGHEVFRISCDVNLPDGWQEMDANHYNIVPADDNKINWHKKRIIRFFKNRNLEEQFNKLVESINPDVIHINNMTYEPITIYGCLKKWPTLQTVRDFEIVCPNKLCITPKYEACDGYCRNFCVAKCAPKRPYQQMIYFWLDKRYLRKINKYRLIGVNKFVCPSEFLSRVCTENGIPTEALNNAFDFSILKDFEKKDLKKKKVYLYYGLVAKHKGIVQLIRAFEKFCIDKDVELHIAGKIAPDFFNEFNSLTTSNSIKYLGLMPYKDIIHYLECVYAVVVPSLWLENYPNTALEGLSTKCLVLGSNRGGIPELIADKNFTFNILNRKDIIQKLENSYKLSEKERKKIVDENYARVRKNNSLDKYYERLIRILKEL